jgi:predicted esterase
MKRILYSLILALGFSACAPLLAPPKEGIEGIPSWVRRRDREERAIANRQIEAARQRQELRAARAKAEQERMAAEAAAREAELAAALAAGEHAVAEGSAVAETVVDTANGSGEGSGANEVATSEPVSSGSGEGSGAAEIATSEPVSSGSGEGSGATEVATSEPVSSGSGEGSGTTEIATSEPAKTEPVSSGSGEGSGTTEIATSEPAKTEPVSSGSGEGSGTAEVATTEQPATEPTKPEPAKPEPAKPEVATAEPEVVPVAPRRERDVQPLGVVQTLGRAGSYFIPENLTGAVPLLILFHGPGDSGALIAEPFVDQARAHGFVILAIDAVNKENSVWAFEVNNAIVHRTKELQFLAKAMEWMTQTQRVTFDKSKTLVAGYSQGASIAAWVGTNERFVSHLGLLHGGFLSEGIGYEVRPVWLSTGDKDDFRTPVIHASTARALRLLGLKDLTSRVFKTDISLSKEECESLIGWWLGLSATDTVAPVEAPAK